MGAIQNHAGKGLGACDIGALANIDEKRACANVDWLEASQLHGGDYRGILIFNHALTLQKVSVVAAGASVPKPL